MVRVASAIINHRPVDGLLATALATLAKEVLAAFGAAGALATLVLLGAVVAVLDLAVGAALGVAADDEDWALTATSGSSNTLATPGVKANVHFHEPSNKPQA